MPGHLAIHAGRSANIVAYALDNDGDYERLSVYCWVIDGALDGLSTIATISPFEMG